MMRTPEAVSHSECSPSGLLSQHNLQAIDRIRTKYGIQGAGLAIVSGPEAESGSEEDWVTDIKCFGIADVRGSPVTEEVSRPIEVSRRKLRLSSLQSIFGIASNSKLFAAFAIGILIERKTELPNGATLDWSTKIKDILPEWKLMDDYASEHTNVMDLLLQRTGLPSHGRTSRYVKAA